MSKSNDKIYEDLELLEQYAHITPKTTVVIIETISKTKKPLKPRLNRLKGFGKIEGKSHGDVLIKCIEILDKIRYLETKRVFKLIMVFCNHQNGGVKSTALKTLENLFKYNLFVLRQVEYAPQIFILSEIEKWNDEKIGREIEIILAISKELLSPTFEGHSMRDYNKFVFHSGVLVVSDKLKGLRNKTISLLKKLYLLSTKLDQKKKVIQVLREATQTPHSHNYGDDMEKMVLENTNIIINFYLGILPDAENEIIQDIEEQKIWFAKRFKKEVPEKINELEEAIKINPDYNMFKVFVGYDGRLDPNYDFNKDRESRSKKIQEFISEISESNFEEWRRKILSVVKNYSISEPGSYGYFENFLIELGRAKPEFAIKLIKENENELSPFFISLLSGIWKSHAQNQAKEIIYRFAKDEKYLYACAYIFVAVDDFDEELFEVILNKAKIAKDNRALNNVLRSIIHSYPNHKNLKNAFLETIHELAKNKDIRWVDNLWFKSGSILSDLEGNEFDVILDGLLLIPNINYQEEEILKPIAEKFPEKIITFFHKRVEIKSKRKKDISDRYDCIPYNFNKLGEPLSLHEKVIVPLLLEWYKDGGEKNNWLFAWEASHLLEEIFPILSPALERALIDLIQRGDEKGRIIVFSIISKYKGEKFLWPITKALIKQYSGSKEYEEVRNSLFGYLSQTGVVSGEDGFVRAYENKKKIIQGLKEDADKRVKLFVKEYESYLDKQIAYEQKRTDEEIELMKRGLD